jgi:hypothetical protein
MSRFRRGISKLDFERFEQFRVGCHTDTERKCRCVNRLPSSISLVTLTLDFWKARNYREQRESWVGTAREEAAEICRL